MPDGERTRVMPDTRTAVVDASAAPAPGAPLSPTVRALGVVSLFADVSSEMVYAVNPEFVTRILGAPAWALGIIEGIAESTASLLKPVAGWFSDRSGRRKPFAVTGYGLSAVGKPLLALAGTWWHVMGARFLDRVGKGIRTAPRDALIAESCHPADRGRAFGFHRGMDTVGAVLGPLIGYFLMLAMPGGFRALYLAAFVPALIGVLVLAVAVRERGRAHTAQPRAAAERAALKGLSPAYRRYLLVVALFGLGNSSDAFLLLRARDMGVQPEHLLLLYAAFNVVEACLAWLGGSLSDRAGRQPVIAAGWTVFAIVYLGFALGAGPATAWTLFLAYGLYYTLTQGSQRALAADLAHPDRRAAEIGAFHLVVGLAAFPASLAAGLLYEHVSHKAPFLLGGATAAASALLLLVLLPRPAARPA